MKSRGLRNNNPGNIDRHANVNWQGMSDDQSADTRFVVFKHPKWGIRAMCRVLITYQDKRKSYNGTKIDTIDEIIHRWAPPIENATSSYAEAVAKSAGWDVHAVLDIHNDKTMLAILKAIIKHENGQQPFSDDEIRSGMILAGLEVTPKPLAKSKTIKAAAITASATGAHGVLEYVKEGQSILEPVAQYMDLVQSGLAILALAAALATMVIRFQDSKLGERS